MASPSCNQSRSLAWFDLYLLALLVLATRLITLLHEIAGHAMIALAIGGRVQRVEVSLFGGGRTWAEFLQASPLSLWLFSWGGIFVNLLTGGLLIWILWRIRHKHRRYFGGTLFLALFAAGSVLGAWAYLLLGLYYNVGDPVAWAREIPWWMTALWPLLLVFCPLVAYAVVKPLGWLIFAALPGKTWVHRLGILLLTMGMVAAAYAGLFFATSQSLASTRAPAIAQQREEARILAQKKQALFDRLQASHPEWSQERVWQEVEKIGVVVQPGEVPRRFPLIPLVGLLYACGAALAVRRMPPPMEEPPRLPGIKTALNMAGVAALVVFVLWYFRGVVYLAPV